MSSHPHGSPARRRLWQAAVAAALAVAAAGCPSAPPADHAPSLAPTTSPTADAGPATGSVVARVNGLTITRDQLDRVLYQSYGINLLADVVELDLAEQALTRSGQTLTDADVAAERDGWFRTTFAKADPSEYAQYYKQLKAEKHLTDVEFDLGFRTTAALRKLAHPQVGPQVHEEQVRSAFDILYGANRRVADIAVVNAAEAADAHNRLKTEPFAQVVTEMSVDPVSRSNDRNPGELPPFSANTQAVPAAVVEATFGLQHVGDVTTDVINDGKRCHVLKLLEIIPPKLVKYEDVRADVRRQVEAELEKRVIAQYRDALRQVALAQLQIDEPTLRHSWDAMIAAQRPAGATLTPGQVIGRMGRDATTAPGAPSAAPSATKPATAPAAAGR